ncbi:DUF4123 domain-containing protein [Pseudomonas sp. REP124]|uniref:DUF4123 domain-containing protein n=1 Tax=Pseudomonas sp. REP124 TaxID=2875731 RepID=UPI001CCDBA25|nr:DUF4123 domain-containing protein [Pseudomonas sp. REP124]MBZ9784863.1 DUF4123 domain-containing protein [Pseudomonas sp. REP124]
MNNVSQANYLLIDGVLRPDALARLYQRGEPLEIVPLYLGTRWSELQDLGPILVSLLGPSTLIDEEYQQADASLLSSRAPQQVVADHLRRFIAPPDVLGGSGLLRFADPLVAHHWLESYQGTHLDGILGPIEAWHTPEGRHSWEPPPQSAWRSFLRAGPAPDGFNPLLGEGQLMALNRAGRWRFMERLNLGFQESHPLLLAQIDHDTRAQWFDQRLDEAEAWGLSSESSQAIWIEYSLRWGDGFTQHTDGPYQQWLANNPDALQLAPELRIQRMDDECLDTESHKDM